MPRQMLRSLLICTSFAALGGCQFLGNLHLSHRTPAAKSEAAQLATVPGNYNKAGRDHLRAGNPGLAIDAYNLALASGEDPAAAYNGLGVAYARIGRSDLAYRFFHKAVGSDPFNPIYARNLATLMDSPSFTLDQIKRAEPAPRLAEATQPAQTIVAAPKPRVAGKLYRDDNRQFSLTTLPPSEGTAVRDPQTAMRSDCPARKSANQTAACRAPHLPTMHSRNVAEVPVAVNSLTPPSDTTTVEAAAMPAAAAPSPKGKRKTVNLFGLPQAAPQGNRAPVPPNAAS